MACSTVRPRPSQMSRYSWTGSAEVFSTGWWKLDKTWHFYWDGDFTNQNDHRNSDLMTSGDTMISGFPKWTQWFPSRLPKFGIEAVTLRQSPAKQLANKGPMFKRKLLYLGSSKKKLSTKKKHGPTEFSTNFLQAHLICNFGVHIPQFWTQQGTSLLLPLFSITVKSHTACLEVFDVLTRGKFVA